MRPEQRKQAQSNMLEMSGSIALVVIILIGVIFLKISGRAGHVLDTKFIEINEVKLVDSILKITGDCTKNSLVYDSHKYEINGNILSLEISFSKAKDLNSDSNFEIVIEDESLTEVNLVVLQGKSADDLKHIWVREETN